jgi:hypothetical protein
MLNVVNTNICSNKGCHLRSFNKLKLQTNRCEIVINSIKILVGVVGHSTWKASAFSSKVGRRMFICKQYHHLLLNSLSHKF